MSRIFLGRVEHWLLLVALGAVLWAMGNRHMHVRAFLPFSLIVLGLVTAGVAWLVWRHRPGETVTREPFDDAALPHGGPEEDEA